MTQLSMVSRFTQFKEYPPTFLAPILECRVASRSQQPKFSTSASLHVRKRDGNTNRGVSALRGTGLRYPVSMSKEPLPVPVLDPKRRSKITVDENHGLWGFFNNDRKALSTPEEENACGRPWAVEELRRKSWEDLHSLWWVCVKERNRLATEKHERERIKAGYGEFEGLERDKTVRRTQRAIKHTLTERWYAWREAQKLAVNDPEVDFSPDGVRNALRGRSAYRPRYFEEDLQEKNESDNEGQSIEADEKPSKEGMPVTEPNDQPRSVSPRV